MGIFDWVKKILGYDIKNPNGYNKVTYSTGFWEEFNNKEGVKEGLSQKYYPSGEISSKINYKNGEPHGSWKSYYKNGQLSNDSTYKDGKREGEQKTYFKNGKIHEIQFRENDKFISGEKYYLNGLVIPSGILVSSQSIDKEWRIFIDDKLEGIVEKSETKQNVTPSESKKEEGKPLKEEVVKQYKIEDDMPGGLDINVEGQKLFKRDMTGLLEYFKEMPNMERIYNEFTYAIRNGYTVKKYLNDANLINDEEISSIAGKGFDVIAGFLEDMLKIRENQELRKDFEACNEARNILLEK